MTLVTVIDDATSEIVAANVTIESCFPDDPDAVCLAQEDLGNYGEAIVGGGAAPILRIVRALQP